VVLGVVHAQCSDQSYRSYVDRRIPSAVGGLGLKAIVIGDTESLVRRRFRTPGTTRIQFDASFYEIDRRLAVDHAA
jgi:hypothetical protein